MTTETRIKQILELYASICSNYDANVLCTLENKIDGIFESAPTSELSSILFELLTAAGGDRVKLWFRNMVKSSHYGVVRNRVMDRIKSKERNSNHA